MAARELEERAGDSEGIGSHDERSGDMDSTTSSGSIDLVRVKTALLAANSQHTRYRLRAQGNSSPVSSWPPTNHAEHPYGSIRCKRRHRKLEIERLNDEKVSPIKKSQNDSPTARTHYAATQHPIEMPQQGHWTHLTM